MSLPLLDLLTIDQPEQLKALGHPLRLRVLETLGAKDDTALTNRELAQRLGVDPGHLHFHVRMLLRAGLVQRADGSGGREKPYRAVARTIRITPELLSAGAGSDVQGAMLDEVQRAWAAYGPEGRFRSAQARIKLPPERARAILRELLETIEDSDEPDSEDLVITVIYHPPTTS